MLADLGPPSAVGLASLLLLVAVLAVLVGTYRQKRAEAAVTRELLKIAKEWAAVAVSHHEKADETLHKVEQKVEQAAAAVKETVARDPAARTRAGDSDADTTRAPPLPPGFGCGINPADYHP